MRFLGCRCLRSILTPLLALVRSSKIIQLEFDRQNKIEMKELVSFPLHRLMFQCFTCMLRGCSGDDVLKHVSMFWLYVAQLFSASLRTLGRPASRAGAG